MPSSSRSNDDASDHESLHDESLHDALSPTDGYFNERHSQPQDVLVPDPTQPNSQSNKEQEAREDLEARRAQESNPEAPGSSRQQYLRQSPVQSPPNSPPARQSIASPRTFLTETTPLIPTAPPAYTPPSPGSPYHNHSRGASHTGAGIYNTMGIPESFFPNRNPQDLGGEEPLLGGERRRDGWRQGARERIQGANEWIHENQNKILKSILLLLAVAAGIGFVVNAVTVLIDREQYDTKPDPGKGPVKDHVSHCWDNPRTEFEFGFNDPGSFDFLQVLAQTPFVEGRDNIRVQSSGEIHVQQAPLDADYDLHVLVRVSITSMGLLDDFRFERNDHGAALYMPTWIPSYNTVNNPHPCLYVNATLGIKPTVKLSSLSLHAQTLSVIMDPDISVDAAQIEIGAVSSSVYFSPSLSEASPNESSLTGPRAISVITNSGAIKGAYPLYDSLHLESISGSITVSLTPKPIDRQHPRPALLTIGSGSGSIHVSTPILDSLPRLTNEIPARDYKSTIKSHSGAITAILLHGPTIDIDSQSGRIFTELTPYRDPQLPSHIKVHSDSGSIETIIHDSASHPGVALKQFSSKFQYETGSLRVRHPATWEGKVRGKLLTGTIAVNWKGLQLEKYSREWMASEEEGQEDGVSADTATDENDAETQGWVFKYFKAYKGNGYGMLSFEGVSGSVKLDGEEKQFPDR